VEVQLNKDTMFLLIQMLIVVQEELEAVEMVAQDLLEVVFLVDLLEQVVLLIQVEAVEAVLQVLMMVVLVQQVTMVDLVL
jgi:hypothetical protein